MRTALPVSKNIQNTVRLQFLQFYPRVHHFLRIHISELAPLVAKVVASSKVVGRILKEKENVMSLWFVPDSFFVD